MRVAITSLRLFVAVAEELNLTRAAQREHTVLSAARAGRYGLRAFRRLRVPLAFAHA